MPALTPHRSRSRARTPRTSWPQGTRHSLSFATVVVCTVLVLSIFCISASKVAKEVAARLHIFWAISFTLTLCILSLLYFTTLISFYPMLCATVPVLMTNFCLGVAWAIALIAEIVDPNNTVVSSGRRRTGGEVPVMFRARCALSGCVSLMLLGLTLAAALNAMVRGRGMERGDEWEMRRASAMAWEYGPEEEADGATTNNGLGGGMGNGGGNNNNNNTTEDDRSSGRGWKMRGALVKIGILKERPTASPAPEIVETETRTPGT